MKSFMNKKGMKTEEFPPCKIHYSNHDKANIFNDQFIQNVSIEIPDDEPPDIQSCDVL